jgi:hypothetical protein
MGVTPPRPPTLTAPPIFEQPKFLWRLGDIPKPRGLTGRALMNKVMKEYTRNGCAVRDSRPFDSPVLADVVSSIKRFEEDLYTKHRKDDLATMDEPARGQPGFHPAVRGGSANVASGGAYLCNNVVDILRLVAKHMDGGLACFVGSGSSRQEALFLATNPDVRVVTFDFLDYGFNQEVMRKITNAWPYRFRPVPGRFEHTSKFFQDFIIGTYGGGGLGQAKEERKCDFISFDTNIPGALNMRHWHSINKFLQHDGTAMLIETPSFENNRYCTSPKVHRSKCTFKHMGKTEGTCCPDMKSQVPSNMHPGVSASFNAEYQLGVWEK